ncbi:MAG: hypothetical protein BroJett015_24320 [Chloroflexota bacterium]|nr:hypothetical protein [Chloroflexota bacterium]GIK56769.1 MAG: hypothetical protein BroJett015_24320 [Chloroflexota bacterium]
MEEGTAVTTVPSSRFRFKARGLLALAALALLVVVGMGLAYRQVNVQVTAVTHSREEEIRAADRLLVETAVAGDNDLFTAFLSRSPEWTDAQIRLQTRGSLFDRPPMGLWLDTRADLFAGEFLSATQFILAPDLNSAELRMAMPYVTLDEAGQMQPLLLQRTAVYRRQANGWLLAEPDKTFWGDYVHEERPYLDLITPTRDREIAIRLADDLSDWINRVCNDMNCPNQFALQLRLSNNPNSLLDIYSPIRLSTTYLGGQQTTHLSLPTPTLVGLPLDESGYQVLLRGYATHLAQVLLNAYAFEPQSPALVGSFIGSPDMDGMLAAWGLFTPWPTGYNPVRAAKPPPIPLPDQDIVMLCQGSRAPNLFRYDAAAETWFDLPLATEGAPGFYLTPFPAGQGVVLVAGPSVRDGLFRVIWLHDGRERLLFITDVWPYIHAIAELEPGRFLLNYGSDFTDVTDGNGTMRTRYETVEITAAACDDETCPVQPFTKWVQPSPDGRYTLITVPDENQRQIYSVGNAAGEKITTLEHAYNPVWLDGRTLAYVQSIPSNDLNEPAETSLTTAVMSEDGTVQIEHPLTIDHIRAALPGLPSNSRVYIATMTPYPATQPEQLFLSIFDWQGNMLQRGYLLQYDWQKHEWAILDNAPANHPWWAIQQHGRYLALAVYGISESEVYLYDIPNQRWQVYTGGNPGFIFDNPLPWSDDGRWFIVLESGLVRLIAPEYEYQKLLFHGLDNCVAALFVDRARRDVDPGP